MSFSLSDDEDSVFLFTGKKTKSSSISGSGKHIPSRKQNKLNELSADLIHCGIKTQEKEENFSSPSHSRKLIENLLHQNNKISKTNIQKCACVGLKGCTYENIQQESHKISRRIGRKTDYLSCPLCWKNFDSDNAHILHMKHCAKKYKVTTKELLNALDIHKKKIKNKLEMTLTSDACQAFKEKVKKSGTSGQDHAESTYELALGLALSKSLSEGESKASSSVSKDSGSTVYTTLENFGFTSYSSNVGTRKKKFKSCRIKKFALKETTKEERENLISEKAATILLSENDQEFLETKKMFGSQNTYNAEGKNSTLHLWQLGENENIGNWYVEGIKSIIQDEIISVKKGMPDKHPISSQSENIQKEIEKLNLPISSIYEDWKKLINNKHLSDTIIITRDHETMYLHSIVLYARCPKILNFDLKSIFLQFDRVTVLHFLHYLYSGVLCGLMRSDFENLLNLAQVLNYDELVLVLNSLKKNLKESSSTINEPLSTSPNRVDQLISRPPITGNYESEIINGEVKNKREFGAQVSLPDLSSVDKNYSGDSFSMDDMSKIRSLNNPDIFALEGNRLQSTSLISNSGSKTDEIVTLGTGNNEKQETVVDIEKYNSETDYENKCITQHRSVQEFHLEEGKKENDVEDYDFSITQERKFLDLKNTHSSKDEYQSEKFEYICEKKHEKYVTQKDDEMEVACMRIQEKDNHEITNTFEIDNLSVEKIADNSCAESLSMKNKSSADVEYDVPYFDPYEHFNCDFTVFHSLPAREEGVVYSQASEISFQKQNEINSQNTLNESAENIGHEIHGNCTPIEVIEHSPTINKKAMIIKSSERRKTIYDSVGKPKKSSVVSPNLKKSAIFIRRNSSSKIRSENIMRRKVSQRSGKTSGTSRFNVSIRTIKNHREHVLNTSENYVEVTPKKYDEEEYTSDVSPLPNYSTMGVSTIKKHLGKYGLKRSLSKNKAIKILKYIYDELHPILNTENGKIIKYLPNDSAKHCRKKVNKEREFTMIKTKDETSSSKMSFTSTEKCKKTNAIFEGIKFIKTNEEYVPPNTDGSKIPENDILEIEDVVCCSDSDSLDRTVKDDSDGGEFDIKEPLTQNPTANPKDLPTAVYDFIQDYPDIHRKILTYEPIWLEEFRNKLFEAYKKKYKLSDLMDYLDRECISYRCESQVMNRRKKQKRICMKKKS